MNPRFLLFLLVLLLGGTYHPAVAQVSEPTYTVSINVASDRDSFTNYRVTLVKPTGAREINNAVSNRYSLITFNTPRDILWAGCAQGYRLTSAFSKTGDRVFRDPAIGAGVEFSRQRNYNLTITCSSRTTSSDDWNTFWATFRSAVGRRDKNALRRMMASRFDWALDGFISPDEALQRIGQEGWNKFWLSAQKAVSKKPQPCQNTATLNPHSGYCVSAETPLPIQLLFERGSDGVWRWSAYPGD